MRVDRTESGQVDQGPPAGDGLAPFLPFALPDIGEEEIARVTECLRSGWLTTGPVTREFEQAFSRAMGGRPCLAVSSATAGFGVVFDTYGIGPGDEVISSCWTFSSPTMEAHRRGAKVVLVDVDPVTLNMDLDRLEDAITPKTKAIIVTHFAGRPVDLARVNLIAKPWGIRVFEDAAHALPAFNGHTLVGAGDSDAVVFSFYATKTMTTGEGGMVVIPEPFATRARKIRLHGFSRDAFDRYTSAQASWRYDVAETGLKANLTDLASAIGIVQLKRIWAFRHRRRAIASRYLSALSNRPVTLPAPHPGHAWHLFVIGVDHRDAFVEALRGRGIGCSVHFIPLHLHSFWAKTLGHKPGDFPAAEQAFARVVSLPIYTRMTDDDVEWVAEAVRASTKASR